MPLVIARAGCTGSVFQALVLIYVPMHCISGLGLSDVSLSQLARISNTNVMLTLLTTDSKLISIIPFLFKSGILNFILWWAEGSSKIHAGGPNEHHFMRFLYVSMHS